MLTGVSVSQANNLLGVSYPLYRHAKTILHTAGHAFPAVLHGHVQTVAPMTCLTSHATADTMQAFRRGSSGAGEGDIGRARDGAAEPR